jgi:hypothetical protein
MERIWAIASVIFLIVAALFLWRANTDAAFVLAALGALAWILDYRHKLRGTIPEDERLANDETEEFDEEQEFDKDEEE